VRWKTSPSKITGLKQPELGVTGAGVRLDTPRGSYPVATAFATASISRATV